ncbi:MAG TPA: hypothetical protein VIV60_21155, partial [Polyangiaceae bacterium]
MVVFSGKPIRFDQTKAILNPGPGAYLVLRLLVSLGIVVRFLIHRVGFNLILGTASIIWIVSCGMAVSEYRSRHPRLTQGIVLLDVLAICLFHWATGRVESDFYLFFAIPVLTAAEYLPERAVLATTGAAGMAFLIIVLGMPPEQLTGDTEWYRLLVRVFLPRALFFFGPILLLALRIRREQDATDSATNEPREAQSLLRSRNELDR